MNDLVEKIQDLEKKLKEARAEVARLRPFEKLATYDPLTGALNRRGLNEKLESILSYSKRHFCLKNLSLIFFDIDNFRAVNNTYGHAAGDEVLKSVVSVAIGEIRETDFVCRWGGEEFIIILPEASEDVAYRKSEEVRKKIEKKVVVPSLPSFRVSVSAGVVSSEIDMENILYTVSLADDAMYEAKKNRGKNNTVRYSEIAQK